MQRELLLLSFALEPILAAAPSAITLAEDKGVWMQQLRAVLAPSHLTDETLAITGAWDDQCGLALNMGPGEALEPAVHGVEAMRPVLKANPGAVMVGQKLWAKPPQPGYPLGRCHRSASDNRRYQIALDRRRQRKAADPAQARAARTDVVVGASTLEEESSASAAEVAAVAAGSAPSRARQAARTPRRLAVPLPPTLVPAAECRRGSPPSEQGSQSSQPTQPTQPLPAAGAATFGEHAMEEEEEEEEEECRAPEQATTFTC